MEIKENIMEIQERCESEEREATNRLKLEKALEDLYDFNKQIWSINNMLRMLYSFLEAEDKRVSEPSGIMVVCIWQLEYIYKHLDELFDTIHDCCRV